MTQLEYMHKLLTLYDKLSIFALSLTHNIEEAKDLIQETYLKALTNREKFSEDTNLQAWTFTIMRNTFINNYRHSIKVNTVIDHSADMFLHNIPRKSQFASPESLLSLQEINRKISSLKPAQRMPFEMHTQGYKYLEIADHLNLSIGTVKSRIFFTRKLLMESLRDFRN